MDKTTHHIIVRPLPDDTDPQGWRRLRAWLKAGLRSYRLQCTDIGSMELLPQNSAEATSESEVQNSSPPVPTEGGAE